MFSPRRSVLLIFATCCLTLRADEALDRRLREYLEADFPVKIEEVIVDATAITVRGRLLKHPGGSYQLCEIKPQDNVSDMTFFPHSLPIRMKKDRFDACIQRYDGTYDRICSRWAVVRISGDDCHLASHAVYPTDVAAAARWNTSPRVSSTKKGLNGIHPDMKLLPDLVELGVGHVALNVNLGSFVSAGSESIECEDAGLRLKLNADAVHQLDRVVQFADEHGIVATAIVLVPRYTGDDPQMRLLTHPDSRAPGEYSLTNVTSDAGVQLYTALLRFLAERYSRADSRFGRITNWILHNEVDSAWIWTNAGTKSAIEFMDQYVKAMRITYYSVRAFNPHAKVFISLTHCWNESFDPHSANFYRSRNLLELLEEYSRAEGDFEWGVAFHPYPRNLFKAETWKDSNTDSSFDTPYITPRNIEVLARYLDQNEFRYKGQAVRSVLLSEQGFHSGKDDDEHGQEVQAAALAYTWKKINAIPCIEAFHYHRWIDHEREGGLHLGLWTVKPGSTTWPEKKKLAYGVFKALGTATEDSATESALKVIGVKSWQEALQSAAPQ